GGAADREDALLLAGHQAGKDKTAITEVPLAGSVSMTHSRPSLSRLGWFGPTTPAPGVPLPHASSRSPSDPKWRTRQPVTVAPPPSTIGSPTYSVPSAAPAIVSRWLHVTNAGDPKGHSTGGSHCRGEARLDVSEVTTAVRRGVPSGYVASTSGASTTMIRPSRPHAIAVG